MFAGNSVFLLLVELPAGEVGDKEIRQGESLLVRSRSVVEITAISLLVIVCPL
jgi:hypothetical protein